MSVVRCPHCKMPLVDDETRGATCPLCNGLLSGAARDQPPASAARSAVPWLLGALLLALAGVAIWFFTKTPPDGAPQGQPIVAAKPDGGKTKQSGGNAPTPKDEQPAPKEKLLKQKEAEQVPAPKEEPPPEPKAPPEVKKDPQPKQVVEVVEGDDRKLDRPDGEYVLGDLERGTKIKLSGRVKTLKVGRIDGGSALDASKLEAKEVIFTSRIDGGSTVKLNAPGGKVEFRARVDGGSHLEVQAPGGTVTFTEPSNNTTPGSKIDGNSTVAIAAKEVDFRGIINGTATRVLVTLTEGGVLRFRELNGHIRLHYRLAAPGDPEPTVEAGIVRGQAEVKKIP